MAPEYVMEGLFSINSNVYSFRILMLEMFCEKKKRNKQTNSGFNNTELHKALCHMYVSLPYLYLGLKLTFY